MASSRWAPPRQLFGFVALLVLLFFWAYYVGVLAGVVAPGLRPAGAETGVEQGERRELDGHGHGM
ncbi:MULTISPECIES: hypothetical protein [Streptomyces]|uniref:Uncharacterized protein n=2 Tax=Streptomyces TaxID=1883 RepID=A0A100Y6A7_9ACTN|nr:MULTISPECIES: hypothetical protein [Streptomyces]KUH38499.1 hypothetical protein ATE80_12230 [Streptomyces kanasensis]UUS30935.1 hypothetical protein NRO40_08840 [Streptomyces changanensis]